jgi:hypothetical protein
MGRGIALLFHVEGGEWSAARPGRTLPPKKDPVPILQEAGWAPEPVWTGGKSRPHRDSIPDRPARSSVAIPSKLPGPLYTKYNNNFVLTFHSKVLHSLHVPPKQRRKLIILNGVISRKTNIY